MTAKTHLQQVRAHLEKGWPITPKGARLAYSMDRLAARICELRQEGMAIQTELVKDEISGNRFARYSLG